MPLWQALGPYIELDPRLKPIALGDRSDSIATFVLSPNMGTDPITRGLRLRERDLRKGFLDLDAGWFQPRREAQGVAEFIRRFIS